MWALFPDDTNRKAVLQILNSEHETVVAVIGGALLDEHVTRTLKERLCDPKFAARVLKPDGPLGNLKPKIKMLYLLGAIDKITLGTMEGIAEIRNFFAHNLGSSFDSVKPDYEAAVNSLKLHQRYTNYPHAHFAWEPDTEKLPPIRNRRERFIVNLQLCLILLMRDRLNHETNSNRPLTKEEAIERRNSPGGVWKSKKDEPWPDTPQKPKTSH